MLRPGEHRRRKMAASRKTLSDQYRQRRLASSGEPLLFSPGYGDIRHHPGIPPIPWVKPFTMHKATASVLVLQSKYGVLPLLKETPQGRGLALPVFAKYR